MKKTNIILSFVICILLYGCTDLSETVFPYSICAVPDMEKINSRMMLIRIFFILTYLLK